MKRVIVISLLFICSGIGGSDIGIESVWAAFLGENMYARTGVQCGGITGYSKFHTEQADVERRLEFSLSNWLLGLEGVLGLKHPESDKHDRARLTVGWLTNINNSTKVKDLGSINFQQTHDFGSSSKLRTHIIDANMYLTSLRTTWIGLIIGYRYQYFDFNIHNLIGTFFGTPLSLSGHFGDYTVKYHIPYGGLNFDLVSSKIFRLNSQIAVSYAFANDRHDDLWNDRLTEANCDGPGIMLNTKASWEFVANWLFRMSVDYTYMSIEGTQDQSSSATGTTVTGIPDTITYSGWIISGYLGYRF
jgi:outer membrane receptor protein involved in Fe transport